MHISHSQKILFPKPGYTKSDVAEYYERIASRLLPYLKERPISMERAPDGLAEAVFYQKQVPNYFPQFVERVMVPVKETGEQQEQVMVSSCTELLYLVDQGMITPHPWLSRSDGLTTPDKITFDLDPPEQKAFVVVKDAARRVKRALEVRGLTPYLLATGGTGLHVVAPLKPSASFDEVRAFAQGLATEVVNAAPEDFTVKLSKRSRRGRVFIDYLRNAYGQTAVAPYAVRTRPFASVATPLHWHELDHLQAADQYTIKNIFRRLGQTKEPWQNFRRHAKSLPS